jgi:hypothetical protein
MVRGDGFEVTFEALQRMARLLEHSATRLDDSARVGARLRLRLANVAGTRRAHDELETAHRHLARAGAELRAYGAEVNSRYRRLLDSQGGAPAAPASPADAPPDPHPRPFGHPTQEQRRLRQIELLLRRSALGRLSLNERARWGIHLRLTPHGRGSYYDGRTNTIYIDRRMGRRDRALTFVHEMVHANYDETHQTATRSADSLSRRTYIDRMLREEARACVRAIRAELELEAAHADNPNTASELAWTYREASRAAIEFARRTDRLLTPDELQKIGREAGAEAVLDAFRSGDVRTSTTNQPYTVYYGRAWDQANRG